MKAPLFLWLIAGGCLTCAAADDAPASATLTFVDPDEPTAAAVRKTGEQFIDRAGRALISEVERVIARDGVMAAINTVHLRDFELPKPQPGQPRVTALKHTSVALRNPANAPDQGDQAALDLIQTALQDGDPPPSVLVQRIEQPGTPTEWRVYRPLSTMPLCLKCHGSVETLAPDVTTALAQHYPTDRAVGYSARQWRGVMRASLAEPAPQPPAKP